MRQPLRIALILLISCALTPQLNASPRPECQFEISGVSGDLLKNVNGRLEIEWRDSEADLAGFVSESRQAVKDALAPYGYYQASVTAKIINKDKCSIHYQIEKGSPV